MSIFDVGEFMPAESAYQDPYQYREALRAESVKHASYLSSMDQFYAELDEMQRQFDQTMGYKRDVLGFEREKFGETLAWEKERAASEFELQERALDIQDRAVGANEMSDTEKRLKLQESRFLRDYWGEEQTTDSTFDPLRLRTGPHGVTRTEVPPATQSSGSLELTSSTLDPNTYNPFGSQSITEFLGL